MDSVYGFESLAKHNLDVFCGHYIFIKLCLLNFFLGGQFNRLLKTFAHTYFIFIVHTKFSNKKKTKKLIFICVFSKVSCFNEQTVEEKDIS